MSIEAAHVGKSRESSPRRRYDVAHRGSFAQPAPATPIASESLRAIAGSDAAVASEQLQRQAAQLGSRLRTQLHDIDARESEFHARVALMENELRTARLVYREREHAIDEQRLEFERRMQRLNQQQRAHAADGEPHSSLATLPAAVVGEFQPGVIPTATPLPEFDGDGNASGSEAWRKQLKKRLKEIDVQENLLRSRLASIANQQQDLMRIREEVATERDEQERRMQSDRKQVRREFDRDRMRLRERADELERRSIAVQEMQTETTQMHREALELRICAEGLIGQMEETRSPAEVTKRLSALRCQLDDQYKLASQSLRDQQLDIEGLIAKLGEHESRMTLQREEVRGWVSRRQQEIEEQASKLLQRERQLSRKEASFLSLESEWNLQREGYEQEIRRLKRMLAA